MSEYFSDKDDQSFDMPNDDPAASKMNTAPTPESPVGTEMPQDPDESGFGSASSDGTTSGQQQDLMYMGIMAIIIAVMLYILYSMFFAVTKSETSKIEPVKVEAVKVATPAPVVESPTPPTEKMNNIMTTLDVKDRDKIDNQSKNITANQEKIDEILEESHYMSTMVRQLNEAKEKIMNRFEELEAEVDRLVNVTDDAFEKISQLEAKMVVKKKPVEKKGPTVTYHLQAVVEGRAWIETGNGKNMTIKVGDAIPVYGVVTKIDPVNSLVHTSSGKIIKVK